MESTLFDTICPCKVDILKQSKMLEFAAPGGCRISKEIAL